MAQHYLTLRPCIELLTLGGETTGGQTIFLPQGTSLASPNLAVLRLGEHFELHRVQSRTTSFLLLLTSGGLIVYLLYKSLNDESQTTPAVSAIDVSNAATPSSLGLSSNSQEIKKECKEIKIGLIDLDLKLAQKNCFFRTFTPSRQRWSAQNWFRWLLFGDTNDLRGQYFGPIQKSAHQKSIPKELTYKKPNIVYVSPCPNCVRGVCKIKKHHQLLYHRHQYVPILESASTSGASTPNRPPVTFKGQTRHKSKTADCSADDESSDDDERNRVVKESPSRRKKSSRVPPEGRERAKSMARDDESMDSIVDFAGVSGSMVDLVKGAHEVRRLIRDASLDSLASEYTLDIQDSLGGQTANQFDSIFHEISKLKDNCESMSESLDFKNSPNLKSSKSETFSKESSPSNLESLSSSPDLRNLHKIIHSAPRNKALWTLTHNTGFSDNDSNYSPIHRDSSASPILRRDSSSDLLSHDPRDLKYKVALSSNASECGADWEWDSEGLSAEFANPDFLPEHETWLQDDVMELDLEAELLASTFRKRSSSEASTSGDVRLPPSGRSSVMSTSTHQDYDLMSSTRMSLNFSRSSSSNSLKNLESPCSSFYSSYYKKNAKKSYSSSGDESGIEDRSTDFSNASMKSSVTTPLSPVHEVRESPNKSQEACSKRVQDQQRRGYKARRRVGGEDLRE